METNPKKNKRRDLEDFSGQDSFFDEYMERIEEHMAEFFEEAMNSVTESKGFFYGFHMTTGADGKPVIEEFGNMPEEEKGSAVKEIKEAHLTEREPLTDVIDCGNEIKVLAELPGVEMEDIDLKTQKTSISIKVDTEKRRYSKDIKLPAEVKVESSKATYKNGILEVTLKKA